jgi:hypothetical protein
MLLILQLTIIRSGDVASSRFGNLNKDCVQRHQGDVGRSGLPSMASIVSIEIRWVCV